MTKFGKIVTTLAVVVIVGVGFVIFDYRTSTTAPSVASFQECVDAGFPVMESYPRQCRDGGGTLFVETIAIPEPTPPTTPTPSPVAAGKCYVGGCSAQVCSDQEGIASTCEYREEYACYKTAKCERQTSGECGWTESPELMACLDKNTTVR